jgi:hypothetical protein
MLNSDRAGLRVFFASLCKTAMEGSGKPCAAVYDHQKTNWGTKSPVLVVTEAGTEWTQITNGGPFAPLAHYLAIHAFVLYATADGKIAEADSESMLSPIQAGLAAVMSANKTGKKTVGGVTTTYWVSLTYEARSQIEPVKIEGREYRHETTVLRFA